MANNHIVYDTAKPFGQLTAELIDDIHAAQAKVNRIQAVLVQLGALGGGGAGAVLEADALFGVQAGKGDAFVTAIGWMYDGLRGANNLAQDQLANIDMAG